MAFQPGMIDQGDVSALAFPWFKKDQAFPSPATRNPSAPLEDVLKRGREFLGEKGPEDETGGSAASRQASQSQQPGAKILTGFTPGAGPGPTQPPNLMGGGPPPEWLQGAPPEVLSMFGGGPPSSAGGAATAPSGGGGGGGSPWMKFLSGGTDLAKKLSSFLSPGSGGSVSTPPSLDFLQSELGLDFRGNTPLPGLGGGPFTPGGQTMPPWLSGNTPLPGLGGGPLPSGTPGAGYTFDPGTAEGAGGAAAGGGFGQSFGGTVSAAAPYVQALISLIPALMSGNKDAMLASGLKMAVPAAMGAGISALTGAGAATAGAVAAPYAAGIWSGLENMIFGEPKSSLYRQTRREAGQAFRGLPEIIETALQARTPDQFAAYARSLGMDPRNPTFQTGPYRELSGSLGPYNEAMRQISQMLYGGQSGALQPLRQNALDDLMRRRFSDQPVGLGGEEEYRTGRALAPPDYAPSSEFTAQHGYSQGLGTGDIMGSQKTYETARAAPRPLSAPQTQQALTAYPGIPPEQALALMQYNLANPYGGE